MTGVRGSHAGFSVGFCGCPGVVKSGWPWYAPWVWSICMSVTQVGSLPPDVLGLFCKWEQCLLVSSHEEPGQFGRSVWRLSSVTGYGLSYLLEDPWVKLVRASCLVRFKACQQFQDSFYGYGKLIYFLWPFEVQGISWARVSPQYIQAVMLKWSGGWSTGTVGWLSASERGHDLEGWPAMNTKCLVPLPFLPDLILWSTENRSHGSPVLVPPETQ